MTSTTNKKVIWEVEAVYLQGAERCPVDEHERGSMLLGAGQKPAGMMPAPAVVRPSVTANVQVVPGRGLATATGTGVASSPAQS